MGLNMQQLSLDLVEPLTEQLPLPLDYTNCHRKMEITNATGYVIMNGGTNSIAISAGKFETPNLTMKYKKKPNLVRRTLLKLLGMEWKQE